MKLNSIRSKLFQREEMQPLERKDYPKIAVIVGIIVIPLLLGLVV